MQKSFLNGRFVSVPCENSPVAEIQAITNYGRITKMTWPLYGAEISFEYFPSTTSTNLELYL